MNKIYGFVYKTDAESNYIYFPSIGRFGAIDGMSLVPRQIFEFDKINEEISNPVKCESIETEFAEIIEVKTDAYKIQSTTGLTYSLPSYFFIPSHDLIPKQSKIRLYKNKVGVLIYGEFLPDISSQEGLEDIYPETISPRLPLKSMKNLFKHNLQIQGFIEIISQKYSSWRKIRGDGNCYYRAVALGYIEYLCRESTDIQKFWNFINSSCEESKLILKNLMMIKLKLGNSVKYCEEIFQNTKNDEILIMEIKNRVAAYIQKNAEKILPFITRPIEKELSDIRKMGIEAEGIACNYIGEVLEVNVTSIILDRENVADYQIEMNNSSDGIFLCLRSGHYDLLYTFPQDIEDQFGGNKKSQKNLHNYVLYLHQHIKYLYEKLFSLGKNYETRLNHYFPCFELDVADFWKKFGSFDLNSEILQKSSDEIYDFISQNSVISEILGICAYCQELKSEFKLSCGHLFCRYDSKNLLEEQTDGKFILNKYENIEVICGICKMPWNEGDFKKILGKEFKKFAKNAQIREAEIEKKIEIDSGIVQCKKCKIKSHISKFPLNHSCLCENCFLTQIVNKACPFCNKSFSDSSLKSSKYICASCEKIPSQIPIINHSDHIICSDCELECLSNNKCKICKKKLSESETNALSEKYYQPCFSCKSYFEPSAISVRKCGCLLCNNCYDQSVEFNRGSCVICQERLTILKKTCEICTENFSRDQMITLTCDHYFCSQCLTSYSKTQIEQGLEVVKCPSCNEPVDGLILQSLVPAAIWDIFNKSSIRKKFQMTDCPKCGSYFETSHKISKCLICKYKFCILCKDAAHKGNCNDAKINAIIKEIEGRGERVAQCPGCKYPYTKDEGCEHVTCMNPQCGIEFCFNCSCIRSPTLVHGNHYHREDCGFYRPFVGKDNFSNDCSECKKNNKLCERPKKLKTPRKFLPGEN